MNEKQKKVLLWTAFVIGLMALFPPHIVYDNLNRVIHVGYGFIFGSPGDYVDKYGAIGSITGIRVAHLFIEIAGALIVGGLVYVARKD